MIGSDFIAVIEAKHNRCFCQAVDHIGADDPDGAEPYLQLAAYYARLHFTLTGELCNQEENNEEPLYP